MSDKIEKNVDEMKSAVELEPIVKGVQEIASHVVKSEKRLDEKIDKAIADAKHEDDALRGTMEKGFENMMERLERTNRSNTDRIVGALGIESTGDELREVLPKHYKDHAGTYEHAASLTKSKKLQDPVVYMASNRWFELASKQGLKQFSSQHSKLAEERGKIEEAFYAVQRAAMQEDSSPEGGNLVPTLVASEINRLIQDAGDIWPRARQVALQTKVTQFPAENTAVTVNWITEESALTQGEPTFSQITVQADKLAGRAKFSIELLQDSAPMLLQYLLEVFTEKMAGELDYQLILGDGTAPELLGVVNDGNLVQDTLSTQAALTWARLVNGFTGAGEQSARSQGVWVCSPQGYGEILALTDDQSMPVIQWGASTQDAPAGTLLGRPIIVSNRLGGSLTLDDTTLTKTKILFGPPSVLIAGTRQGMAWDVTDAIGWANYQMDARLVGRFGGRPVVGSAWVSVENVSYT